MTAPALVQCATHGNRWHYPRVSCTDARKFERCRAYLMPGMRCIADRRHRGKHRA